MNQNVSISYGTGHLTVALPENARPTILRKVVLPKLSQPKQSIIETFDNPIGSQSLRAAAQKASSACILICDITRPVPNGLFLRPMIETIMAAGIPKDQISVVVATGLHRPNEGEELAELVGCPWVLENIRVENHFARDDNAHVDLGPTARGTPVKIDRRFVDADLRIVTGLIEPHFMAGWSGGRKVVAPGVAHHETIRTFHSARFMEDPAAIQCNLKANPLHEEQLEVVRKIGDILALNTVLDEDRDLVYVNFGEVIESHLAAVAMINDATTFPVGRRFKTILTSSAGYPLDKTYYQTVKGMVTPMDILEPGGTLIIASECSEGFGSPEFRDAQRRMIELGPQRFLETLLSKSFAEIDEWQTEMQLKPMRLGNVMLYTTGLNEEDKRLTGVETIDNLEEAIRTCLQLHNDPDIAIIPEGPYIVPVVAIHD